MKNLEKEARGRLVWGPLRPSLPRPGGGQRGGARRATAPPLPPPAAPRRTWPHGPVPPLWRAGCAAGRVQMQRNALENMPKICQKYTKKHAKNIPKNMPKNMQKNAKKYAKNVPENMLKICQKICQKSKVKVNHQHGGDRLVRLILEGTETATVLDEVCEV